MGKRELGIAVVGLGGAVGTTMAAGMALLKKGAIEAHGLPLVAFAGAGLTDYRDIVLSGWDLFSDHLGKAAEIHDVLTHRQFVEAEEDLRSIKPWPALGN